MGIIINYINNITLTELVTVYFVIASISYIVLFFVYQSIAQIKIYERVVYALIVPFVLFMVGAVIYLMLPVIHTMYTGLIFFLNMPYNSAKTAVIAFMVLVLLGVIAEEFIKYYDIRFQSPIKFGKEPDDDMELDDEEEMII